MIYKKTITCSFCFHPGHNKRSCATRKEWLKSRAENGNSDEMVWAKEQLMSLAIRKCSFCRSPGHTKTNCDSRRRSIHMEALDCLSARRKILANMTKQGYGIGTLVRFNLDTLNTMGSQWETQHLVGLVVSISWSEITHLVVCGGKMERKEVTVIEFVDENGEVNIAFCRLPESVSNLNSHVSCGGDSFAEIVSKTFLTDYPEDFLSYETCLEQVKKWYK